MKKRDIFIIGFMLFAMFFGAGNLIFPVGLGYEAGPHYLSAIIGFMLTGIGLPLLTMIAGSFSSNGYPGLLNQIHPLFSSIFLTIVYIMIGPFSAIPRTTTTSYEMGLVPLIGEASGWSLFLFSVVFFAIVLFLALSPDDLSDAIGKYLTPILLFTIAMLIIRSMMLYYSNNSSIASGQYVEGQPLSLGFLEGYLTMDSIGALAFTLVLTSTVKQLGVKDKKQAFKGSMWSSVVASGLLGIIYFLLSWVGNHIAISTIPAGQNPGAYLLVQASKESFGQFGVIVLGLMVLLACLTTSTGLVSSVAGYFHQIFPKVSYRSFAVIVTIFSCAVANLGLNQILEVSTPILSIIYPITITIVFAMLFLRWQPGPKLSAQLAIFAVAVTSVISLLARSGVSGLEWFTKLPLFNLQLEWLPIMVITLIIGYCFGSKEKFMAFR